MHEEVAQCTACNRISPLEATGCSSCGAVFGPTFPREPTFLARMTDAWRGHAKVMPAPKPHDPTLAQRKREAASLLRHIKPEATLRLARALAGILEFSPPFDHYARAFVLSWTVGIDDEFLADQLERDTRLHATERLLLLEARAEVAIRDLDAVMNGVADRDE